MLCVVQLFRFVIIKIKLDYSMFISKLFYFYKILLSFHECDCFTFSLSVRIMLLRALSLPLSSYFVDSHAPINWWGHVLRNASLGDFIRECTYTNPDSTAYCSEATNLYSLLRTQQHEIKSSPRENEAIKRHDKYEMSEAAAGMTRHIVL